MDRKNFLSAVIPASAAFTGFGNNFFREDEPADTIKIPAYLKPGDTIAITSVAGYITVADCSEAILTMQAWGFNIKLGSSVGKKDFAFGGRDEERLSDFEEMLDDDNVKAIMCARGGYGIIRIIDMINFKKFIKKPKWIIGFSDATVLHSHINKNFGIASLHSKMCNSFVNALLAEPIQKETIDSIRKCLMGEKMVYTVTPNAKNKIGRAKGLLVGGNLKTLETLACSKSDINTQNKILFVEDTGEYLYSIDRMFWNLKRSGKLEHLAGLIIGGFKIKKDDAGEEFGETLEQIVLEKVAEYYYPVCFDFPVGHQKNNFAVKCGVMHDLDVNAGNVVLKSS